MNIKLFALPLAALCLGACSHYASQEAGPIDPEAFGEANRQTFAAMIVDPDPQYEDEMVGSAEVASDAVDAYREGRVEEAQVQTSGGLSQGLNQ